MLNETTMKAERELILSDPIVCAVLQIEADKTGVTLEEYCDCFLTKFYESPQEFLVLLK